MKIEKYISALLYRYQCVTVPGFGAFLTEWQSAQVIEGQHSFIPPRKIVSFNSNIKSNDGLLANHIALTEKISYDQALSKINYQVNFWLEKLQNKETLSLENIGDILVNNENNWVFKPNQAINYLTDSFGLSSFNSPEIQREVKQVETPIETPTLTLVEEEHIEENNEVIALPQTAVKSNTNWLKYVATVAIFASAGTFGYKYYYDYSIEQKTLLVEKTVQEQINKKIQEATFIIPNPTQSVDLTIEKPEIKPYHVIAAAFRSENNAKKAMEELKKQGYLNATVLPITKHNLYPVAFESFSTLSEANKLKNKIITEHAIDAWLKID